jgi:tetratricopeptide (TPR) repeat protein
MLVACETALDVPRAEQWLTVIDEFVRRSNFVPILAICRMYYGGILTAAGRWSEAEAELSSAIRIYDTGYRGLRSGAVVRLADLRVRQGRFEEAAQLLDGYESDSYAIRPIIRLHLALGEPALADTALRRHRAAQQALTGAGALQAPLLALLVELAIRAGRPDQAHHVSERLQQIAARAPGPLVRAYAAFATGITCAATLDRDAAAAHLEQALAGFTAAQLPWEAARTRLELGRVLAQPAPDVAVADIQAALASFETLHAAHDADAAARLLRELGAPRRRRPKGPGMLSRREIEVC